MQLNGTRSVGVCMCIRAQCGNSVKRSLLNLSPHCTVSLFSFLHKHLPKCLKHSGSRKIWTEMQRSIRALVTYSFPSNGLKIFGSWIWKCKRCVHLVNFMELYTLLMVHWSECEAHEGNDSRVVCAWWWWWWWQGEMSWKDVAECLCVCMWMLQRG